MKRLALPVAIAAALVTGCAHPAYVSPVEVTRFVGDAPAFLAQGTIAVMPAPGIAADSLEYSTYADAVRAELEQLGYRVVLDNPGQVAIVDYQSYTGDEARRRSPVGVGVGGSTGSYGSGVGVGVGINLNSLAGKPPRSIARELFVAIQQPGGTGPNLWEGRADMVATSNSDFAGEPPAAARLAEALFEDFPGNSGETVTID